METVSKDTSKVQKFLTICNGYGRGYGDGDGYGSGTGYDMGCGSGVGYGRGYGGGDGYGSGAGYGRGCGDGDGYGRGYGGGDGYGSGAGYGLDEGVSMYRDKTVHVIDGLETIITCVYGDYAKGYILQGDLTLKPCYIAKSGNYYAHGDTLAEAVRDLNEKLFSGLNKDERIAAFWKCHEYGVKYPAIDLYEWHHKLTGSCEAGRKNFAAEHGINIETDSFTVDEFVELCKDSYGGDVIRRLCELK